MYEFVMIKHTKVYKLENGVLDNNYILYKNVKTSHPKRDHNEDHYNDWFNLVHCNVDFILKHMNIDLE